MSKKGATIIAGAIGAVIALIVILNLLVPWNSPLKVLLTPKKYEYNRLYHNAMANYQMGAMEEAKPIFIKLLKLKPENPDLHYRMGVVQSRLGETDEAIQEFEQAYKLSGSKMSEAQASIAAINIMQAEDLLKNDRYRDAGTLFDKANDRLDTAYEALRGRDPKQKDTLSKEFNLLRGQVYIGQGLSELLYSDRVDVAIERFATAESVFKAAPELKPFREFRKLAHAYADLARVYQKSYLDKQTAQKYWKKSFSTMELAIAAAQADMKSSMRFGDPFKVFRRKYESELKTLKKEAKGQGEQKNPAPAPEPKKMDNAIEIFE